MEGIFCPTIIQEMERLIMVVKNAEKTQMEMQYKLLSLRNDAVFKLFFTREENINQLRLFLKATTHLTDEDLVEIEILGTRLRKEHVQDKDFIVDIRIKDASGNYTHIEMQVRKHHAFIERIVAYNSRQYSSQLSPGDDYVELKRSISIVITDFEMFDDTDEYYEYITYRRDNGKIFTNAQEYYILDLTKLPDEIIDEKEMWGALFKAETEEELRALMAKFDEMNEAGEKLLALSEDKDAQEIARAREESQWAWKHTLYHTEKKGREDERKKIAVNMLAINTPISDIAKVTGLTEDDILELDKNG